ncbi:thiamine phosphate synthase [Stieleria varia]|uniref:Thiamine-phosphate synthase n=1 Tax=Stieleria varia TaxID=2528005 RepID=A0A5C6AS03_9BACT|nr:thiamine phosphate synthase [Stieleria varia]TWU02765.1 Thiamine-phosphate synthase [Stieleria varia]
MNGNPRVVYRILDASANRAGEGLRTLEEYARFARDDAEMSAEIKSLRHDLANLMKRLDRDALLAARNVRSDVGTTIQTKSEYQRTDTLDVVVAAGTRVAQSMRCLEEYGKILDPEFSKGIESLRYRVYIVAANIERSLLRDRGTSTADDQSPGDVRTGPQRRDLLAGAMLYALVDVFNTAEKLLSHCDQLTQSGVDIIQLRDKNTDDRTLYERSVVLARRLQSTNTLLIINDRTDIAIAAGADGVHLGQSELPIREARRMLGSDRLIGASTHTIEQVHRAIGDGADYIGCGPVFPGATKSFDHFPGVEFLGQVHSSTVETPRPAFAIGGINEHNIERVLDAGFHRIAVSGAIRDAASPGDAAAALKQRLLDSRRWRAVD